MRFCLRVAVTLLGLLPCALGSKNAVPVKDDEVCCKTKPATYCCKDYFLEKVGGEVVQKEKDFCSQNGVFEKITDFFNGDVLIPACIKIQDVPAIGPREEKDGKIEVTPITNKAICVKTTINGIPGLGGPVQGKDCPGGLCCFGSCNIAGNGCVSYAEPDAKTKICEKLLGLAVCNEDVCIDTKKRKAKGGRMLDDSDTPEECLCDTFCLGDPHFSTWTSDYEGKGIHFDFHGQCDLVFADAPKFANGLGLLVHIRTTKRDRYSFIESAAIQIGDDILEVGAHGNYIFNGVSDGNMPDDIGGAYPVSHEAITDKQHQFKIQLAKNQAILIGSVKDLVQVKFENATDYFFGDSLGMMGSFETGQMVGRDGAIMTNPNDFGQEWQVLPSEPKLFQDKDRIPQAPMTCIMPDPVQAEDRRRLGESLARSAAKEACSHWEGKRQEACVFDVLMTGDPEVAAAGLF